MIGRIAIEDLSPGVGPKAVVGDSISVSATVWREGHAAVNASLVVTDPQGVETRSTMTSDGDRFYGTFAPTSVGPWSYRVEGWGDPYATWRAAVRAKLDAGQSAADLANDLETGARLLGQLPDVAAALRADTDLGARVGPALDADVAAQLRATPIRELVTTSAAVAVTVERRLAAVGSWYEFFPRSTGTDGAHGTFTTARAELPRIAAMGFDVVYLPPIHPIGERNRKGPNNSLVASADDVGSPWAIGSRFGGHDAIHPELGSVADLRAFVAAARDLGLEVALDLALQCAPDHPWTTAHPEWFFTQPDGTIAYAENPPKKYQDIYPLNFDTDPAGIAAAVLDVVRGWIDKGVTIFRVDNPHTKPPDFWQWLIAKVHADHPEVVFLSEAFTRAARLYGLARLGFSQSYTYFTWQTSKADLTAFGLEWARVADDARPNLFVNTPDILHASLQYGGPSMFAQRAVLAATLGPSWGVYSGYELYEHLAVHEGSEEYLDSEKYQLRPRDYQGAAERGESLAPWITRLNEIRRAHPALQQQRVITFHHTDNDALLAYSKFDPRSGDQILVVVNLNPFGPEEGSLHLDLTAIGRDNWHESFDAYDEVTGQHFGWGASNYIRLDPTHAVAHIVALPPVPADRREQLARRS